MKYETTFARPFSAGQSASCFSSRRNHHRKETLQPLIKRKIAEAILLDACFTVANSFRHERNSYLKGIKEAATLGSPEAIYLLGVHYDQNTSNFLKRRASRLFRKAADRGHARSQWIYATELLWGIGHYNQNISRGLLYLRRAESAKLPEAYETLARLHETGEFDHPIDPALTASYRALAKTCG